MINKPAAALVVIALVGIGGSVVYQRLHSRKLVVFESKVMVPEPAPVVESQPAADVSMATALTQPAEVAVVDAGSPTPEVLPRQRPARVGSVQPAGQGAPGDVARPDARDALAFVGLDPGSEAVWSSAINDPNVPANERKDLIEDLNQDGFANPDNVTRNDLPLIQARIALIESMGPSAMDDTNTAAFHEAYKDLLDMAGKASQ